MWGSSASCDLETPWLEGSGVTNDTPSNRIGSHFQRGDLKGPHKSASELIGYQKNPDVHKVSVLQNLV